MVRKVLYIHFQGNASPGTAVYCPFWTAAAAGFHTDHHPVRNPYIYTELRVDKGQYEASMSLGIGYGDMMKDIIIPQAVKHILPSLVNEAIALLKESSILSYIGAVELLRAADQITVLTFRFFEPYLVIAVIYYVFVMILSAVASRLERWVNRSDRVS